MLVFYRFHLIILPFLALRLCGLATVLIVINESRIKEAGNQPAKFN
jgi:hypothetical protein